MSRRTGTLIRAVVLAVAVVAAAAGCADAPVAVGPPTGATAAPAAAPRTPAPTPRTPEQRHAADVAYAQAMLPHVDQGLELTSMVPGRVADPDLARLVVTMDRTDAEEQGQLVGQLHAWRAPVPGERGVPVTRMPGMADDATLDRLRTLSGPAFDRAWLATMIAHHEGGGAMSRDYLAGNPGGDLGGVAETTIGTGGRQLDAMHALLDRP